MPFVELRVCATFEIWSDITTLSEQIYFFKSTKNLTLNR